MSQPSMNFMGVTGDQADPAKARYAVLSVPYEGTVSYKTGTAAGPAAILDASQQVELFDDELRAEFIDAGVATYPPVENTASGRARRMILRLCHIARSSWKPPRSSVFRPLPRSPEKSIALNRMPRGSTSPRSIPA
jgi:hypothetical protein